MPSLPPRGCQGCRRPVDRHGWYCSACVGKLQSNQRDDNAARMRNDPIWKLYRHPRWPKFVVQLKSNGNLFCQRIVDGVRCTAVATLTHHLISPRKNTAMFVDYRNIVRVCHLHHPPSEGDDPNNEYVPTLLALPGEGIARPAWYPQPSERVSAACPRWTCANVEDRVAGTTPAPTGIVGNAAVDRALAGVAATLDLKLPGM
jgi:hypothetical protein